MERRIVDLAGTDYPVPDQEQLPETRAALDALDWNGEAARGHEPPPEYAHGRIETHAAAALDLPKGMLKFRRAR